MNPPSLPAPEFYGNSLLDWLIAAGVFVLVLGALALLRRVLVRRAMKVASRTANGLDDLIFDVVGRTHTIFLIVVALAAASLALTLGHEVREYIAMVLGAAFIIQLLVWGNEGIGFWVKRQARQNSGSLGTLTAVAFMARLMLWALMIVLLLDNFGIQVTTLIGALGVAGIAGALAAQTVLGDLLAAISIYLDKPFEVGDFIIFDDFLGTVSSVGLRSTRIASLSGEEVVVSNSDLLKSRIRNYKRMAQRRIVFQLGIAYGTPREKVERIPGIIRAAVEEQSSVRFDRSHFKGYSDSSLDFETVYYVLSPDYNVYMDIQQAINLVIMRRFEDEGIRFAHPVRVMRMAAGAAGDESALVAEGTSASDQ
ncbi:MAG TPA: mechanosensitive ion channel family protein [Gemmatimonadaceae bacterium]|nr:mechanosensitive ion channel family protein [Gemmatimonadaceae bacterium]